jgi:hypothetical protein
MGMYNIKNLKKSSFYQFANLWNKGKDFLTLTFLCFLKVYNLKKVGINRKEKTLYFVKKQILKFIKINGWYENR